MAQSFWDYGKVEYNHCRLPLSRGLWESMGPYAQSRSKFDKFSEHFEAFVQTQCFQCFMASIVLNIYIIIYHYISLYIIIYHCISLYIIIYHYISLYIIIYHYISLYIIIYNYIYIYHLFIWWEDSLPNLGSFLGRRELRRWVSCPPHHEPRPAGSATRCGTHGSKLKYPTGSHRIP